MTLRIDNRNGFALAGRDFQYDLYFLDSSTPEFNAPTHGGVFEKIVLVWARALAAEMYAERELFFPFCFDDHWIDSFKVTIKGGAFALNAVRLAENGHFVVFSELEKYVTSPHPIEKEWDDVILSGKTSELLSLLTNAEVEAEG